MPPPVLVAAPFFSTIAHTDLPMLPPIPTSWRTALQTEAEQPYYRALDAFLAAEVSAGKHLLPAPSEIFAALELCPLEEVKVLLLGQDPYPTPGDAHGLCFSVQPGRPVPRSLRNIFKELSADVGFSPPGHGNLRSWARQGILLLNTVMTVRAGEANSHRMKGWERFTDRIVERVAAKSERVVFVLWGNAAKAKATLIEPTRHRIVACAHPSPLSARLFMGCRCFSEINRHLHEAGLKPVVWQLPATSE